MLSLLVVIGCIVTYFWLPKKIIFTVSLIIYMILAAATASIILETGGFTSPFIVVWTLVSISACIYGVYGLLMIIVSTGIYAAILYMNHSFDESSIAVMIISSLLPLIAGAIIWHTKSGRDELDDDNKAYKNLANELSEVASKSEVVINAIGDGVIAIDSKGIIKLINPAAQQILGWDKQDAVALSYASVMHLINQENDSLDVNKDPIQQVLNTNQQVRDNDLALITKNEKKLQISLVVSPVGDIGSGVIVVFRDITKEKSEEREQFEFISTASHEMRTPVAAIEGYLSLALNTATASIDPRARGFIERAHESVEHLGHLFQDLLDVSKADDGRMQNNPKVIDIVTLTGNIVQELTTKAIKKNIRLIFKPIAGSNREKHLTPVYYVNLDKDHVLEIVSNLIENAVKYTQVGEVNVDILGDNDHVTISIKDSGIGIPAEDMPHLFQKFYRVDNKDTREIGGTGLGLYICRRLTEIMGGRIWAESVKGKGSTFFLELPRIDSQQASQLMKIEAENKGKEPVSRPVPKAMDGVQPSKPTATQPIIRTAALTPEQIANYVAKQRILVAEQQKIEALKQQVQPAPVAQPQVQIQAQPQIQLQTQIRIAQPTAQSIIGQPQIRATPDITRTITPQAVAIAPQTQPQPQVQTQPIQQPPKTPAPEKMFFIPAGQIDFTSRTTTRTMNPTRPINMSIPSRETPPNTNQGVK